MHSHSSSFLDLQIELPAAVIDIEVLQELGDDTRHKRDSAGSNVKRMREQGTSSSTSTSTSSSIVAPSVPTNTTSDYTTSGNPKSTRKMKQLSLGAFDGFNTRNSQGITTPMKTETVDEGLKCSGCSKLVEAKNGLSSHMNFCEALKNDRQRRLEETFLDQESGILLEAKQILEQDELDQDSFIDSPVRVLPSTSRSDASALTHSGPVNASSSFRVPSKKKRAVTNKKSKEEKLTTGQPRRLVHNPIFKLRALQFSG